MTKNQYFVLNALSNPWCEIVDKYLVVYSVGFERILSERPIHPLTMNALVRKGWIEEGRRFERYPPAFGKTWRITKKGQKALDK